MSTITAMTIADELRAAITASGQTAYRIAQESGLAKNTIARFMAGENITLDNAEKIAAALGKSLRLGPAKRAPKK